MRRRLHKAERVGDGYVFATDPRHSKYEEEVRMNALDEIAEAASNADGALRSSARRLEAARPTPFQADLAVADALVAAVYELRALRLTLASVTAELP